MWLTLKNMKTKDSEYKASTAAATITTTSTTTSHDCVGSPPFSKVPIVLRSLLDDKRAMGMTIIKNAVVMTTTNCLVVHKF